MVEAPRLGRMMAMGRRLKVQRWGVLICVGLPLLIASVPPTWWQKGFARQRPGSVAEAELLSQLAVLLMPNEPIEEMFRVFPSPEGWGGHYLEPDLTVYGVLKDENAALFVEYDGYWRHGEKEGVEMDANKNAALLDYAPAGSYVVRISHTESTRQKDDVLWIKVGQWKAGDVQSLTSSLRNVFRQVHVGLSGLLCGKVNRDLQRHSRGANMILSERARCFTQECAAAMGRNTSYEISRYLHAEGFSRGEADRVLAALSPAGISIEQRLQPCLRFLSGLGLSTSHAAKVVAGFPQILGYSVEQNLEPTVEWLLDLGLTKGQVAKAVAGHPQMLGLSTEQNLKPTVQWLLDLGLSKAHVAKAVAGFPQILGYSIEQNLKPTVQWLLDLGLSKAQVAKAVAGFPQVLALSIEQNLQRTVQWLSDLGLSKAQVAKAVAGSLQILGLSIEQNLNPTVGWLLDLGLTQAQVAKAVALFPPMLWLSIEQNLKPTVQWLLELGLGQTQVARVVARFPQILGLSISKNLNVKRMVLEAHFGRQGTAALILQKPNLVSYRLERLTDRLRALQAQNKTRMLQYAMTLDNATFAKRFG